MDVYERDGKYQLYASEIELSGRGDLYLRFEKLLKELEEMGMFDPQYKRPIPRFAKTVGIVTAPTGAAIRDIMNIAHRRNPYVQLILYPALVQGDGAKDSIVKGIRTLDAMGLDVLIVGAAAVRSRICGRLTRRRSRERSLRQYACDLGGRSRDGCDDRGLCGGSSGANTIGGG